MPLQSNDIATQMGDLIASNMGDTALTFRNNAPNDKTYVVTILGVGQDFTDDVAQAEQESIVKKYNIPAVSNDDTIYYTFKLEGIYYSVRQNGNFKLYEQTLLRVPNNNWDRMFLERLGGEAVIANENDLGFSIHVDIMEPPSPTYDAYMFDKHNMLTSDLVYVYWVVAAKDGIYTELYVSDIDKNNICYWRKVNMICSNTEPQINSKIIEESGEPLYWIKPYYLSGINFISKTERTIDENTGIVKYKWKGEKDSWVCSTEFSEYTVDRTNLFPTRFTGTFSTYDSYHPSIYISTVAPSKVGDIWYKITDLYIGRLYQIYECQIANEYRSLGFYELSWFLACELSVAGDMYTSNTIPQTVEEYASVQKIGDYIIVYSQKSDGSVIIEQFWAYIFKTLFDAIWRKVSNYETCFEYPQHTSECKTNFETGDYFIKLPDSLDLEKDGVVVAIGKVEENGNIEIVQQDSVKKPSLTNTACIGHLSDGDYWAKVNNMTDKKLMSFYERRGGEWQLKYSAYTPTIYAETTDPATLKDDDDKYIYDVQVGDYWAKTEDDQSKNITAFYERFELIKDNGEHIYGWSPLFNCNGGGGGGQTVTINIENAIIVDKSNVLLEEDVPNG